MGNYVFNRMEWDEMANGNIKFKFARMWRQRETENGRDGGVKNIFCVF